MALTLVNLSALTAAQKGVELDETGINIASIVVRYFAEIKDKLMGKTGEARGFAVSTVPSRDITIEGEVGTALGLMALTWIAAATLANDTTTFGSATGGIYLDEVTETQTREGWRSVSFRLSSNPGIA